MYFPIIAPDGSEVYPIHDNGEEARWAMGKGMELPNILPAGTLVWKRRNRMGKEVWEPYCASMHPKIHHALTRRFGMTLQPCDKQKLFEIHFWSDRHI